MPHPISAAHPGSTVADEAPPELVIAQHHLQKLALAAPHNQHQLQQCIDHQLRKAEQTLIERARHPGTRVYLAQIADARIALHA